MGAARINGADWRGPCWLGGRAAKGPGLRRTSRGEAIWQAHHQRSASGVFVCSLINSIVHHFQATHLRKTQTLTVESACFETNSLISSCLLATVGVPDFIIPHFCRANLQPAQHADADFVRKSAASAAGLQPVRRFCWLVGPRKTLLGPVRKEPARTGPIAHAGTAKGRKMAVKSNGRASITGQEGPPSPLLAQGTLAASSRHWTALCTG